jgi:hypothetical protein
VADNNNIDITDFQQLPPKRRTQQNQKKRNFAATMDNYTIVRPKPKKACENIQPSDQGKHDAPNPERPQREIIPAHVEANAPLPQHPEDQHCDFIHESTSLDHVESFPLGSDVAEHSDFQLYDEATVSESDDAELGVDGIISDEQSDYFRLRGDDAVDYLTSPSAMLRQ